MKDQVIGQSPSVRNTFSTVETTEIGILIYAKRRLKINARGIVGGSHPRGGTLPGTTLQNKDLKLADNRLTFDPAIGFNWII